MKKLFTILSFILFPVITFAQFSGTYYIGTAGTKPGGGDPNYTSLKSACDALNSGTVSGDCTFYITSDLIESVNCALGVDTKGFTITFKPSADESRTIAFTATSDNGNGSGASGAWLIGSKSIADWNSLTSTSNIIIDGYADGSTVQRLTIKSDANAHIYTFPVTILGNANNIIIKNCVISHLGSKTATGSSYGISIRVRNASGNNYIPNNISIENCIITATSTGNAQGIGITNSGTPTVFPSGIVIKNNTITAKARGIFLTYAGNTDIINNTISVNQNTLTGTFSSGIFANIIGAGSIINISNNKFTSLLTSNTSSGDYGAAGIWVGSNGTYNIYNNFITGFSTNSVTINGFVCGIKISSTSTDLKVNIQHNSIVVPETKYASLATDNVFGIWIGNLSNSIRPILIRNNIITCQETNTNSYLLYRSTATSGLVTSDYNNLYFSTSVVNTGYWGAAKASLNDWQTVSGNDLHSVSEAVNFLSGTDLHLASSSYGNTKLIGCPISEITTDIDGDARNASYPYMGADEIPGSPLPVELTSFSSLAKGSKIELIWNTAIEVNTAKFEIERKSIQSEKWEKIGEINAHGNSNSPKQYSFVDNSPLAGKNVYRLKMIDNDGSFEYSSIAEVNFAVSQKPDLLQNYPNPFNPETVIRFSLPEASTVSLKIYNSIGEEVAELVNGHMDAGIHNVTFNASNLASGVYLYKLQTENFVKTMKMQLVK